MNLAGWADALRGLLSALEMPEPDPRVVRLRLERVQRAYTEARSYWAHQGTSGEGQFGEGPEPEVLLALLRTCMERARRLRAETASKLEELRAGREMARAYRRAAGSLLGSGPTPYDWRI